MTGLARVATLLAVALLSAGSASAQQPAPAAAPAPAPQAAPASTAAVASVKTTNGKVLLNRAAAYDPATKDQRLLVGDRLVVLEGGAITLRFDGGCEQTIDMATVYTVPATPPCDAAAADRGMRAPVQTTAAAGGAASGEYLKWGLIGLGVITPLLLLSNSDSGTPISP
jgi:glucose/arabinose dehydrogenase